MNTEQVDASMVNDIKYEIEEIKNYCQIVNGLKIIAEMVSEGAVQNIEEWNVLRHGLSIVSRCLEQWKMLKEEKLIGVEN